MRGSRTPFGLGRLLYLLWHSPRGRLQAMNRAGGPLALWRDARGRAAMTHATRSLALPAYEAPPLEVQVLTGRRFWYQTAFCLSSLSLATGRAIAPVIIDDGTLAPDYSTPLRRLFPLARLASVKEVEGRLNAHLPAHRYPVLRARRVRFPLLRKLTDVHAGLRGWKLFLDSDMLFFRRPQLLLDWLAAPTRPLCATDVENAYGYSLELLAELAGCAVSERINTGLLGLQSEAIDWDRMEYWCDQLISRAGTHYFQEQALVAMLLAGQPHDFAPISDYVTYPRAPETEQCQAVMHHYVAESKRPYLRSNWRKIVALASTANGPCP